MKKKIYTLTEIRKMYEKDRVLQESLTLLQGIGYTITEHYDLEQAGLTVAEENPKVKTFLERVLDNLEYFGHLVEDKIDNYILGRLYDVAKSFSVDKVIEYLKHAHCYC